MNIGDILKNKRIQAPRFWLEDEIVDKYATIIKGDGIAVYCVIARHANKSGTSHPSITTLCDRTGISRKRIGSVVKRLVDNRLIKKVKVQGKVNYYKIIPALDRATSSQMTTSETPSTSSQMTTSRDVDNSVDNSLLTSSQMTTTLVVK